MNKDLSHDLRLLAEHISPVDFRALSSGIGLGATKVDNAQRFQKLRARQHPVATATGSGSYANPLPQTQPQTQPQTRLPDYAPPHRQRQGAGHGKSRPSRGNIAPHRGQGKNKDFAPARKRGDGGLAVRGLRKLCAHSVDLLVVVACFVGTSFTFFYVMEANSFTWQRWSVWLLGKWLRLLGPLEAVVGCSVGLLIYTLLFRFVAGATLGELCMKAPRKSTNPRGVKG